VSTSAEAVVRCWTSADAAYNAYHDFEWGRPVTDERGLYERLCLEGFQSGLSWLTILRKRENFRRAFHDFDPDTVARLGARDVSSLLQDPGIVRHRGKIEAVLHNAGRAVALQEEFGSLAAFFWRYEIDPATAAPGQTVSVTAESTALSKDLKKRGWKFVGPTTVYAFMQAMGLVNDHAPGCVTAAEVAKARRRFKNPQ
jgi:DNA-3-methyladenine glycosylase I